MFELIEIFNLPFEIQGIARYNNGRVVIDNCNGSYKDINYNCAVVCYIRSDDNTTYSKGDRIGCNDFIYVATTTMHLIIIDVNYKYNIDSLCNTITNQLINDDITLIRSSKDFIFIKDEERLTEIKNGQLLKYTFSYTYEVTKNCDELICNC